MDFVSNPRFRIRLFLTILLLAPLASRVAAAIPDLLHKTYKERSVTFITLCTPELIRLTPAAAVGQVAAWLVEARAAKDPGAVIELEIAYYAALEAAHIISVDEKIARSTALLQQLDAGRNPEYAVRVMADIGNNYFGKKHNYSLAFEQYLNAYSLAGTLSSRDFPEKKHIVVAIGNRYYALGDLDRARAILLEADTMQSEWIPTNNYNAKNTLGLICRATGKYDSAIAYFRTAYTMANADSNSLWAAIAKGNIGICYYMRGDYDHAVPLLREDIETSLRPLSAAEDNGVNSLLILGDIYFRQGKLEAVAYALAVSRQWLGACRDRIKPLSMIFALEARLLAKQGNFRQAYAAQDSATIYKDSLIARDNILKVARVEHRKDQQNHEAQLRRVDAERKLAVFSRNSLLAGICLLGVIAFLGISRQRLRNRERHRQLLLEREQAERQLRMATEQLTTYTRHLQEKNAIIERSTMEIEKLQETISDSHNAAVKNEVLQQLYNSTILTDEEWTRFKRLFEQVHRGYLQHLKDKLPELTPADTRFLVLSKLALSSKEMSGILGVAPDTIRSYRHRLRKRFEQSDDPDIRNLISGI